MKLFKKSIALILTVSLLLSLTAFSSGAVTSFEAWIENWDEIRSSNGYITLTPGKDNSEINFSWQSDLKNINGNIKISTKADMSGANELDIVRKFSLFGFEWTFEATATGLIANTTYYYQYTANGETSEIYSFTTGSTDTTRVLFVSDSQIGRSDGEQEEIYQNDTYGWNKTLETAMENIGGFNFIMSSGDQVEDSYSEEQYTMFESSDLLRSYPVAATIGNHDFYTPNFSHHFNNPNRDTEAGFRWPAGNSYYFSYNNVLFIVLDSNNFVPSANNKFFEEAVKAYPDVKWRIVMMHHSPYDANEEFASTISRFTIAPYIDKYDVDLVLNGHQHHYCRSHIIKGNAVTDDLMKNGVYTNPDGTLYITANSSSGSNYDGFDEDEITRFNDFHHQSRIPTYTVVDADASSLIITTYQVDASDTQIDKVTIIKD